MGANGKGNGKKPGKDVAKPADEEGGSKPRNGAASKAPNGKAKAGHPAEDEAQEAGGASSERAAEREGGEKAAAGSEGGEEAAVHREGSDPGEGSGEAPSGGAANGGGGGPVEGHAGAEGELRGAAWAHPLARFEQAWTRLESKLLTFVLVWLIASLVAWVFLNGLCESVTTTAGTVFRAVLLAGALGWGGLRFSRGQAEDRQRNLVLLGIALGVAITVLWQRAAAGPGAALSLDHAVVAYFDNMKGWLQDGSTLALLGGLRGLATRLTLWLALLGGSLATASGKHIHVDVVFRFLPKGARKPVAIMNYLFAGAVCFAAVWGFFDHIAITSYGANADAKAGAKIELAVHHVGNHLFFTRKQIGLDLRTLPRVLSGTKYDTWMTAQAWNDWVADAGFESHFAPEKVKNLRIESGDHPPFVVSPDGETTRGALVHTLGLVFPFGLFAIGLRFLLRALLTLSGHFAADPDEAHKEDLRGASEDEAKASPKLRDARERPATKGGA